MSVTRGAFKLTLRTVLQDKQVWRDSLLEQWIAAGLWLYSLEFPRQTTVTITCVDGQREYSLITAGLPLSNIIWLGRVEYPKGEEPPRLLSSMPETWTAFYGGQYYDIREAEESLVIGETPSTGEEIYVGYATYRDDPVDDNSNLDIAEAHLDFLMLYVQWQAAEYVENEQSIAAELKSGALATAGLNAFRAERAFRSYSRDLRAAVARSLVTGPWRMDKWDRSY